MNCFVICLGTDDCERACCSDSEQSAELDSRVPNFGRVRDLHGRDLERSPQAHFAEKLKLSVHFAGWNANVIVQLLPTWESAEGALRQFPLQPTVFRKYVAETKQVFFRCIHLCC